MFTLESKIEELPAIGPAYVRKLHKVGIETARDLLFYFPFRYDDFSDVKKISEVELGEVVSVVGKIVDIQNIRTRKRKMSLTEALIEDDTGVIKSIWFNQPFLTRNLKQGINVSLSGKIVFAQDGFQISNPSYELLGSGQSLHTARFVPIYHETEGLSSKWLRAHLKSALKLANEVEEFLPTSIIKDQNLLSLSEAILQIHFPEGEERAQAAKRRLAFDELFLIQLYMMMQKKKWQENKAVKIEFTEKVEKVIKDFIEKLPFKLTNAQKISSWNIIKDFEKNRPMNRLLEGDVGSGKTLVALISALAVMRSGYQVAFMAPTEILARQHFIEAVKRFGGIHTPNPSLEGSLVKDSMLMNNSVKSRKQNLKILIDSSKGTIEPSNIKTNSLWRGAGACKIALLTGSESKIFRDNRIEKISRLKLLEKIKTGEVDLIVGTHSLIQKKVEFYNLAYSVIDEQHRFGIEQRGKLQNEIISVKDNLKTVPHLLSMTATPIPRTLALTVYGDLDLSVLDEMPKGRQKIITKLVAPANRNLAYKFIGEQVQKGRQVFVICPLIEESDVLEVRSATEEYEKLSKNIYPDLKIGLLHGKMKPKEKEDVMQKFSQGKIDILVSTSVVEVGIDIPNASVMLVEGSDRFGLAQLHQFRGRVGRGKYQSFCFLFTDSTASKTHQRLKALIRSDNGFELAEQDLKIRGPGELVGIRQSGIPDLAMASLADFELIKIVKEEAKKIIAEDDNSQKYPKLSEKLKKFTKKIHFE